MNARVVSALTGMTIAGNAAIARRLFRAVKRATIDRSSLLVSCTTIGLFVCAMTGVSSQVPKQAAPARDPGVRAGAAGAGAPLPGVTKPENEYFLAGQEEFEE